jgi:hypothetical protein
MTFVWRQMHKELKENAEEEARLIKRMQELSAWPKDNKQWLSREIRIVLREADKIGMTDETPEIVDVSSRAYFCIRIYTEHFTRRSTRNFLKAELPDGVLPVN